MKEYIIYESELPWWIFWIKPTDAFTMSHYGYVCYGCKPPKIYWKYIAHNRYPELVNKTK